MITRLARRVARRHVAMKPPAIAQVESAFDRASIYPPDIRKDSTGLADWVGVIGQTPEGEDVQVFVDLDSATGEIVKMLVNDVTVDDVSEAIDVYRQFESGSRSGPKPSVTKSGPKFEWQTAIEDATVSSAEIAALRTVDDCVRWFRDHLGDKPFVKSFVKNNPDAAIVALMMMTFAEREGIVNPRRDRPRARPSVRSKWFFELPHDLRFDELVDSVVNGDEDDVERAGAMAQRALSKNMNSLSRLYLQVGGPFDPDLVNG